MTDNIFDKLFLIQKRYISIKKDGKNPHFKNAYITLDKLISVLHPLWSEYSLLVIHYIEDKHLVTKIYDIDHESHIISSFPLGDTSNPQKVGSCISYGKRYNLCSIFNIVSDVDDDGNQASEKPEFNKLVFDVFCHTYKTYGSADEALKKIKTKYIIDYDWENKVLDLYT